MNRKTKPPNENEILERGFSPAFNRLVRDTNDFVGIIAYGVYKLQKTEFVTESHLSRDHDEVKNYFRMLTDQHVHTLRDNAKARLDRYTEVILQEMKDDLIAARDDVIIQEIGHLKGAQGFLRGVSHSIVGSLVVVVVSAALLFAVWLLPIRPLVIDIRSGGAPYAIEEPLPAAGPNR